MPTRQNLLPIVLLLLISEKLLASISTISHHELLVEANNMQILNKYLIFSINYAKKGKDFLNYVKESKKFSVKNNSLIIKSENYCNIQELQTRKSAYIFSGLRFSKRDNFISVSNINIVFDEEEYEYSNENLAVEVYPKELVSKPDNFICRANKTQIELKTLLVDYITKCQCVHPKILLNTYTHKLNTSLNMPTALISSFDEQVMRVDFDLYTVKDDELLIVAHGHDFESYFSKDLQNILDTWYDFQ